MIRISLNQMTSPSYDTIINIFRFVITFYQTDSPGNHPRTGGENPYTKFVQKNPDGSWKVRNTEVRYGILTSSAYTK
jgi:hypothetical protein